VLDALKIPTLGLQKRIPVLTRTQKTQGATDETRNQHGFHERPRESEIQTIEICAAREDYSGAGIQVRYHAGIVDERIDPQICQIDADF
jgi:hypothetical protein